MTRPIDDIAGAVRKAITDALTDAKSELTGIAEAGGKQAGPGLLQDVGSVVDIITGALGSVPIVGQLLDLPLTPIKAAEKAAGKGGTAFGIGYLLGYTAFNALNPVFMPLNHAVADAVQTEIFDPNTAAQLQAKGIIDDQYGRSEAAGGNLSGEHYDKLADSAQSRPTVMQALEMWNRQAIAEADVNTALRHATIPEYWWPALKSLRRNLLSPADLALANLRGNIDATTMQGYAMQLGVDPNDMQVLIDNTGEPPGLMQLLFLFRRGLITEATLERGVRQSRVRNEWMDAVKNLRYQPMTTADAARAVVENYMHIDQGAAIAQQNGLDPDHWPFIVESWGRPPSHEQMMTLFHRGQATIDEVKQAARESDIKDKYIDKLVELGRTLLPERMIVQALARGVVTHDVASSMLQERGYNTQDADVLLRLGGAERLSTQHALTRSDILTMFADSLLTKQEAVAHLAKLGYSQADSEALIELTGVKTQASARRTMQRAIEASLKAKHITQQQAITQLEHGGIESAQARGLVDEWLQQRGATVKTLTEAQTVSAAEAQLITPQECYDRLRGIGYSAGDARILMQLKGIPTQTGITFN